MNEVFLDTETTGLSPRDGHKLVEIACIETNDLITTQNVFHKVINPERDVPQEAFNVHGFSTDFLKGKETFIEIAENFLNFIKDKKLIIHNASFDLGFLNHQLKQLKMNEIQNKNIIDTLEIARGKFPGSSNSLDGLCRRFNIDLSRRTKHNALLDCELLREVYINLLDAKEPKLEFTKTDMNEKDNFGTKNKTIKYSKIITKPTPDELKLHNQFLKKELKKNFF
jgi:DNA polymerase-3 subunit epsilon|tara:strand:+ start:614 stop:1288 length:675 start_codon:yes stop_codon:yes gene_type:complete